MGALSHFFPEMGGFCPHSLLGTVPGQCHCTDRALASSARGLISGDKSMPRKVLAIMQNGQQQASAPAWTQFGLLA